LAAVMAITKWSIPFSGKMASFRPPAHEAAYRRAGFIAPCLPTKTDKLPLVFEWRPSAVFGELSVLLDQPHTADVRALEPSQFHVADAATIVRIDPIALLYVATVLAQRLDSANRGLLELKRQVQAGEPPSVIGRTVEKIEEVLGATGANLMYAGYPYDPFAPGAPRS
jgi:CRP-like cAMP-binding protein